MSYLFCGVREVTCVLFQFLCPQKVVTLWSLFMQSHLDYFLMLFFSQQTRLLLRTKSCRKHQTWSWIQMTGMSLFPVTSKIVWRIGLDGYNPTIGLCLKSESDPKFLDLNPIRSDPNNPENSTIKCASNDIDHLLLSGLLRQLVK